MSQSIKKATLYRMSTPDHQCPFGLKTRHLLKANGYDVDDNLLESREETDIFKEKHNVSVGTRRFEPFLESLFLTLTQPVTGPLLHYLL